MSVSTVPITAQEREMYNEDQILDWGCDLATQKILMKNVEKSRTPLTHHGHPGREVTFVDPRGSLVTARVILVRLAFTC